MSLEHDYQSAAEIANICDADKRSTNNTVRFLAASFTANDCILAYLERYLP